MLATLFFLVAGLLAEQQGSAVVEPVHRVSIDVLGPLAQVQVERDVAVGGRDAGGETVLDVDLPERAALLDWEAQVAGKVVKFAPVALAHGRAAHAALLSAQHLSPSSLWSEGATARVHLASLAGPARLRLRYRYAAPMDCVEGRLLLRVPASLDAEPAPAQVTVRFRLSPENKLSEATVAGVPVHLGRSGSAPLVHVTAPRRAAWELSYALAGAAPFGSLSAARSPGKGREPAALMVASCRPLRSSTIPIPEEILLLIDRSRSVGAGGMSHERELARTLIESLPPAVRFNAFLFARSVSQVFSLPRSATRETLDALAGAADPNRLENGTDLVSALGRVAAWIKGDASQASRLLVIISDGAIPQEQTAERLSAALGAAGVGERLRLLILMVRPGADEPVSDETVERMSRFAERFGGVVRVLAAENLREVVRLSLLALGQGGDLFNPRMASGPALAANVAPGQGFAKIVSSPRETWIAAGHQGKTVRASLRPAATGREWLLPLRDGRKVPRAWAGQTREAALFVEEIPGQNPAADGVVRGQMDPMVLRNALSLAFLPRARACYLSRRVGNSTDMNLRGRVRLELHLERGELEDAIVAPASTLNRPEIEHCLREAAFEIEYPRPMFRNASTVAALNLAFRPSTPAEEARPDASAIDREIDLILGPVTFDPKKLLEEESENGETEPKRKTSGE